MGGQRSEMQRLCVRVAGQLEPAFCAARSFSSARQPDPTDHSSARQPNGRSFSSRSPGAEAAQEFYSDEEVARVAEGAAVSFSEEQRYLFDLNGFIHLKGVLSPEEVLAANQAIDANASAARERKGVLRNTRLRTPLAGDGKSGRMDLGGMLRWPQPYCEPFRQLLHHPLLLPALTALCGPGYRLDHLPLAILQHRGSEGFALHGGPLDSNGRFNPALQYRCVGGHIYNTLLACAVQLSDHSEGDGGFVVVRGSHKSNMAVPRSFIDGSGNLAAHLHQPVTKAGDVILFSEATVHGATAWKGEHQRRVALYRFAPAGVAYGRAYHPQWGIEGLTPAQSAVLEPPYVPRLDRPVLQSGGDEEVSFGAERPDVKKEFDLQVFGQKYF